jgi:hypothetical protein
MIFLVVVLDLLALGQINGILADIGHEVGDSPQSRREVAT